MKSRICCRAAGMRRSFLGAGIAAAAVAALPVAGSAQEDFPERTIDIMVHAGAGGGTDLTANAAISGLRETVGWDAAINRQTGAGGAVSHQYVTQQPCDGHNVFTLTSSQISTIAQGKSPITIDQLTGIGRATVDPIYLMAAADGPYQTAEDFLAAAKEEPMSIGLVTIGGGDHITVFLMAERGDLVQPQAVPSESGGTAAVSVVAGDLDAGMVGVSEAGAMIDAGDIQPIIAFTEERQEQFPDVPTAKELGMDLVRPTLRGFAVLDCTPEDRVEILRDGFAQAMATEGFQSYLRNSGIPLNSVASGEVFEEAIQREHDEAVEALTALGLM